MAVSNLDLWPSIPTLRLRTPVSILREQAALLGPKTQNAVQAEVSSTNTAGAAQHTFNIVAPSLNYSTTLFTVEHRIELYPIKARSAAAFHSTGTGDEESLPDEETFVEWLREQLSSERTVRLIQALMSQINP